jgi:hypothetical protein
MGRRNNGPSDQWAVGIMGCRNNDLTPIKHACTHVCTTRAYDFSISQLTDIPKTSIKTGTTITRKETKPEKETNSKNGNTM